MQSAQELCVTFTPWDVKARAAFLLRHLLPAETMASHNLCVVFWPYMETAVDSVLDASLLGEFSTKAHEDLSHPTEKAVFLDGSLFMHEETWLW